MEEIRSFYHKLHKYRKLGEKLILISVSWPDTHTFRLEDKISELYDYVSANVNKIEYDKDILSYLSKIISYGDVDFKYLSGTPEYKIFYEVRKLNKLVGNISKHVKYTKGTMEFKILMESDRFSEKFEFLIKLSDGIKEILDNFCIDEDKSNLLHSELLKVRNRYVKSIRETKFLPIRIGDPIKGKPGRIEVKFNCGIVKPKLDGIYVLPYDYLKRRYSNEFISIDYEQDLEILPNRKETECKGETVELYKVCILKVTGDVGDILMTYRFRCNEGHWSYPFSEGSFYATFKTFSLKSLLK